MWQSGIGDRGEAHGRVALLAILVVLGCAGPAKPPASGALSEAEAVVRHRDLTIQALVIIRSGPIWRGMMLEALTEDERRGL
jgi:hypothetical protein